MINPRSGEGNLLIWTEHLPAETICRQTVGREDELIVQQPVNKENTVEPLHNRHHWFSEKVSAMQRFM